MCIQPCCHGNYIYGNTFAKLKVNSNRIGRFKWGTPLNTGAFSPSPASGDLDMIAKRWYYSRSANQIRYVNSDTGLGETTVFSVSLPTANHHIQTVRVFPSIGKILFDLYAQGGSGSATGSLFMANLDGSATVTIDSVATFLQIAPVVVAYHGTVNLATSKVVYIRRERASAFVNTTTTLRHRNFDGSGDTQLIDLSETDASGIDQYQMGGIDYANQYIYFTNRGTLANKAGIWRCQWDGSAKTRILSSTAVGANPTEFLYWGEARQNRPSGRLYYWIDIVSTPASDGLFSIKTDGTDNRLEMKKTGVVNFPSGGRPEFQKNCILGEGFRNKTDLYS